MAKFSLPGQTKALDPNAADTDALTLFYKSLHEQRPESEMASRWLLQHGLLPEEEAARLVKLYGKGTSSKGNGAAKSPTKRKAPDVKKAKASAAKAPARKKASQGKDSSSEDSSSEEEVLPAKSSRSLNPKGKKAPEAQKAAQPRPKKPAMDSSDEDVPLSQKRGNGPAAPR
ncbi:hypothetical protein AB1Y20_001322 [Prymnesium parvum]|uniref:Uncharacterized protein n=1 Tax=Prymnesium parvum TaxID=97485 RepID=A0AB34KB31_PRYPA